MWNRDQGALISRQDRLRGSLADEAQTSPIQESKGKVMKRSTEKLKVIKVITGKHQNSSFREVTSHSRRVSTFQDALGPRGSVRPLRSSKNRQNLDGFFPTELHLTRKDSHRWSQPRTAERAQA